MGIVFFLKCYYSKTLEICDRAFFLRKLDKLTGIQAKIRIWKAVLFRNTRLAFGRGYVTFSKKKAIM